MQECDSWWVCHLEKSIDVTNTIFYEFIIPMETIVLNSSWIDVKKEQYNRIIQSMVISVLVDSNQHEK